MFSGPIALPNHSSVTPVTCSSIFSPCRVDPVPHDAPKPPGYTRFVCVSDTHSRTDPIQMPYGDVLIHAGDFTELGLPSEVKKFNEWLGRFWALSIPSAWEDVASGAALSCPPLQLLGLGLFTALGEPSLASQTGSCAFFPPHLGPPFPTLILTVTAILSVSIFGLGDPPAPPTERTWLTCVWSPVCSALSAWHRCS